MLIKDTVAAQIEAKMQHYQMPGISIRLMKKHEVVYALDLGVEDIKTQTPVTSNSVFGIGCSTKPLAALALHILFEKENLSLSTPVHRFIPTLKSSYPDLEVGHLIEHTGGLWRGNKSHFEQTDEETLRKIEQAELLFPSGSRFKYSNWGYFLIGSVIEAITGVSRAEYVRQAIFEPLNMRNSMFRSMDAEALPANLIKGYWNGWYFGGPDFGRPIEESPVFPLDSFSGGLLTTTDDYTQFLLAITNPESSIVSQQVRDVMFQPSAMISSSKYSSKGFLVEKREDRNVIYFPGSNSGFASFSVIFPEAGITGLIFGNRSASNTELRKYLDIALAEVFPEHNTQIMEPPVTDLEGVYHGLNDRKVKILDLFNEFPVLSTDGQNIELYHQNPRRYFVKSEPSSLSMMRVYRRKERIKRISIGADYFYPKLPKRLADRPTFPDLKRFTGMFTCEFFDRAQILQREGDLYINWGAIYETRLEHLDQGSFVQHKGPFHLEKLEFNTAENEADDSFTIAELVFKRVPQDPKK